VAEKTSGDPLNYQAMTEDALRGVVRQTLSLVSQRGLPGQHHFYLTFRTAFPGVQIADHLRQRHPQEMTIVLQHQYWGLEVSDAGFSVTLSFNGQHERLVIPFAAVSAFVDPSVQFGLQFSVNMPEPAAVTALPALPPRQTPPAVNAPDTAPAPATGAAVGAEDSPRVVTLDSFRKTDSRKK
jgi:hypothetical protein